MAFTDDKSTLNPEKTPLFIGKGVIINGAINHEGSQDDRAVILGELRGDITWDGLVQVTQGGSISKAARITCRELVVAGDIHGDGVVIEAGILRLEPTASVQVDEVLLPPGGLEQSRGSFFTGRLTMSGEHKYADMASAPVRAPVASNVSAGLPSAASFTESFQKASIPADDASDDYGFGEEVKSHGL